MSAQVRKSVAKAAWMAGVAWSHPEPAKPPLSESDLLREAELAFDRWWSKQRVRNLE